MSEYLTETCATMGGCRTRLGRYHLHQTLFTSSLTITVTVTNTITFSTSTSVVATEKQHHQAWATAQWVKLFAMQVWRVKFHPM